MYGRSSERIWCVRNTLKEYLSNKAMAKKATPIGANNNDVPTSIYFPNCPHSTYFFGID